MTSHYYNNVYTLLSNKLYFGFVLRIICDVMNNPDEFVSIFSCLCSADRLFVYLSEQERQEQTVTIKNAKGVLYCDVTNREISIK